MSFGENKAHIPAAQIPPKYGLRASGTATNHSVPLRERAATDTVCSFTSQRKHFADNQFFKVTRNEKNCQYHAHGLAMRSTYSCVSRTHAGVSSVDRLSPLPFMWPFQPLSSLLPSSPIFTQEQTLKTGFCLVTRWCSALCTATDGLSAPDRQLNERRSSPCI